MQANFDTAVIFLILAVVVMIAINMPYQDQSGQDIVISVESERHRDMMVDMFKSKSFYKLTEAEQWAAIQSVSPKFGQLSDVRKGIVVDRLSKKHKPSGVSGQLR